MKVLIVDDEDDIRRIAGLSLSVVGGMQVCEASSGAAAVESARREAPDVILLDMMMPGMDGAATYRALREQPETAATPIVFLTAKTVSSEEASVRALGARGVLVKPFDPMTLPRLVRELVNGS